MSVSSALPLLVKEMTELAAQRRTYITRVVFAVLLFGAFAIFIEPKISISMGVRGWAGTGYRLFYPLIIFQAFGVYLFMPALAVWRRPDRRTRTPAAGR